MGSPTKPEEHVTEHDEPLYMLAQAEVSIPGAAGRPSRHRTAAVVVVQVVLVHVGGVPTNPIVAEVQL